jgi:hypothetical protein
VQLPRKAVKAGTIFENAPDAVQKSPGIDTYFCNNMQ